MKRNAATIPVSPWIANTSTSMRAALESMVGENQTPGGVIAVGEAGLHPEYVIVGSTGSNGGESPNASTRYDIASLTKVVATWPLLGLTMNRGDLDLDTPVSHYFRAAEDQPGSAVTPRQILTHTSGLMASTRLDRYVGDERDVCAAILAEPLDGVGQHRYINRGFILLGLLLARLNDAPLDVLLDDFTHDLGVTGLEYGPLPRGTNVAPTERRLVGGYHLHGVVHDENAHALGGIAGHAGVFASARALATLADSLLAPTAQEAPLKDLADFSKESWTPAVGVDATTSRGLAWLINNDGLAYHHGFTGTSLYLHPSTGRYLVMLTNAIACGRTRNGLNALRATAAAQFDLTF